MHVAKDGVEAVEVFRQHRDGIHCALFDLAMPRMDGWETLTALRKIVPGFPVILASGCDEDHVMDGEHSEPPQSFLRKPYRALEIRDALRQTWRTKSAQ
jgi:two-component system, cell cycle sensor histidine kinase and response regulator CckA